MAKVIGLGGVFFKCKDPKALGEWYQRWLQMPFKPGEGASFLPTSMPGGGFNVWAPFDHDTDYFSPSEKPYMFNLVVDDLEQALAQVEQGGAQRAGEIQSYDFGKFGWFIDPEGNKVELWQPNPDYKP